MIGTVTIMLSHHIFVSYLVFCPMATSKIYACVQKKRMLNCTKHSGKDREVLACDKRKRGRKRKEEYIYSSLLCL